MIKLEELKIGMKVRRTRFNGDKFYTGKVYKITCKEATILRDDKKTGSGAYIPNLNGPGWNIYYSNATKTWMSNGLDGGPLEPINEHKEQTHKIINKGKEFNFKP